MTIHISISGPRGAGKTTAARRIAQALHDAEFRDFTIEDVHGDDVKKGLPVAGYAPTQSQQNIDLVNEGKLLEERVLRYIDKLDQAGGNGATFDGRWLATGKTDIQKGFMSVFRSVFQPQRIELPGDHNEPYVLRAGEGQ